MDAIAAYGMSKGWRLGRRVVLVEGTSDEALLKLTNKLATSVGVDLLGQDISIVAAGEHDRGGTYGVGRELITLRAMTPYILDRDGSQVYRIVGLLDNDYAGLSIPSFNYQMTPKISLNTRCSISISENLSINGQTRSSDQLGIWSYNINP